MFASTITLDSSAPNSSARKQIIQRVITRAAAFFALSIIVAAPPACRSAKADDMIEKGKAIYNGAGACFSCHGPLGAGDGAAAAALNPKPRNFSAGVFAYDTDKDGKTGTETDLFNIISNGAAASVEVR